MVETAYWFDKNEYEDRLKRVQAALVQKGQDALLAFQPETVTWVTGFFTRGYGSFQCAIIPASGAPTLICRDVEAYY
ncbi:MAG: aminopeptidase P family N-terminal domain-containing protein, partial [Geminicoccaceae bacterium]